MLERNVEITKKISKKSKIYKNCIYYRAMLELIDILEEILDKETVVTIRKGRKSIKAGVKGIPVFKKSKKIKWGN